MSNVLHVKYPCGYELYAQTGIIGYIKWDSDRGCPLHGKSCSKLSKRNNDTKRKTRKTL